MRKKYKLTPTGTECMEEKNPLQYRMCRDGVCIYGGSLLGSGFIDFSQGITLPCEIDGIPVTEINYATGLREIEHIEAWSVKRIFLRLYVGDCYLCTPPRLYGGIKDTIESLSLIYDAPIVQYGSFRNRKDITDITFTGTVTEQPDWDCGYFEPAAFQGCCNLHSVSGYFKGRTLSEKTFEDCIALRRIPVLDVKTIGRRAFYNCISLKNVKFGTGLEIISQEALSHCVQLEDVYIPDTVCCIEESVFADCVSLNRVHLPRNLDCLAPSLFLNCKNLEKLFMPDSITIIGDKTFYNCSSLRKPWIPQNIKKIGECAFYGCCSITEITIPEGIEEIGENAFGGIPNLIIRGYEGTVAEEYSKNNNITFAPIARE